MHFVSTWQTGEHGRTTQVSERNESMDERSMEGAAGEGLPAEPEGKATGVVRAIGDLPPGAVLTTEGLADIFGCHVCTIRRAVRRGELPEPMRFMGGSTWLAGKIVEHLEARQEAAARAREKELARIRKLSY